jgi:hypothetical protein
MMQLAAAGVALDGIRLHEPLQGVRGEVGSTVIGADARVRRGLRTATVKTSPIAASATKTILVKFFISLLLLVGAPQSFWNSIFAL